MSAIAPGWKLRVLLAQALFSDPDILLLDEPTNNLDINTIRWLEDFLCNSNSTMVIISHDRHFLNSVCTHMADLDYGELRVFPGNYDEYMTAAEQALERMRSENAKKKAKMPELQAFVSRFSANASKARQATSRARQLEKIQLEEIKPSSRVSPFIRFEQEKPLRRFAVEVKGLSKGFDELQLFENLDLTIEAGSRVAIIGPNGIGKTTLARCLMQELEADSGTIRWAENAKLGYFAQDHAAEFATDMTLFDWITQWQPPGAHEQLLRATLGRMLFSRDESEKSVKVVSGGEEGRLLFGKLTLQKPNVMVMDEPTNHLDMESIEALNLALDNYPGTLMFISHDREFVSSLATRIIEMTPARHRRLHRYLRRVPGGARHCAEEAGRLIRDVAMREVEIHTEPVELFKILKFEGLVSSGGEAKRVIDAGEVRVNGEVETRRRRQIRSGDTIEFAGETLVIRLQAPL